jgi:hypothetical protein
MHFEIILSHPKIAYVTVGQINISCCHSHCHYEIEYRRGHGLKSQHEEVYWFVTTMRSLPTSAIQSTEKYTHLAETITGLEVTLHH